MIKYIFSTPNSSAQMLQYLGNCSLRLQNAHLLAGLISLMLPAVGNCQQIPSRNVVSPSSAITKLQRSPQKTQPQFNKPGSKIPPAQNINKPVVMTHASQILPTVIQRSPLFGINAIWNESGSIEGWDKDGGSRGKRYAAYLKTAGATNTRIVLRWAEVERERGKYDWRSTDKLIALLKASGLPITCAIVGSPDWASDIDGSTRKLISDRKLEKYSGLFPPAPAYYSDLGRLAGALGQRYKNEIHHWEFWSSPDQGGMLVIDRTGAKPTEINYEGDVKLYTRLLKIFSQNLKRADPTCRLAVGGLSALHTDFLIGIYANGGKDTFDAVSLHASQTSLNQTFDWIDACHRIAISHGDANKKFWLTEWGWSTYPAEIKGIPEGEQARLIPAFVNRMRQRPFIEQADLHTLNDWQNSYNDPYSLVSSGICTLRLHPKPAFETFRRLALGLQNPATRLRRLSTVSGITPTMEKLAAHVDIDFNQSNGPLPSLWKGINPGAALPEKWETLQTQFQMLNAGWARLYPLQLLDTRIGAESGSLEIDYTSSDAMLASAAKAKVKVIFTIKAPVDANPAAWKDLISKTVRRYGNNSNYSVREWDLEGNPSEIVTWYLSFAQSIAAAQANQNIGVNISTGDPLKGAEETARICQQNRLTLNSFGWQVTDDILESAKVARNVRSLFSRIPFMKSVSLLPDMSSIISSSDTRQDAVRALSISSRIADAVSLESPNAMQGLIVPMNSAINSDNGLTDFGRSLMLIKRVFGESFSVQSDIAGAHCIAVRRNDKIYLLVWREETAELPPDALILLRLNGIPTDISYRMARYEVNTPPQNNGTVPTVFKGDNLIGLSDLPAGVPALEIPLILSQSNMTLLELSPVKKSGLDVTLSTSNWSLYSGQQYDLNILIRNLSKNALNADIDIPGSIIVPASGIHAKLGMLKAGGSQIIHYKLIAPIVTDVMESTVNLRVGVDQRASLTLRVVPPVTASLEQTVLDTDGPFSMVTARIRLLNQTNSPISARLIVKGLEDFAPISLVLPGNQQLVTKSLTLRSPSRDPGSYPIDISLESSEGLLATNRIYIGVPLRCPYANARPSIDGDLSDWSGAEPMGMGRADQFHDKVWHGPSDLSATAFCQWDEQFFYFACSVIDDVFYAPYPAAEMWKGDSVQFAISVNRSTMKSATGYTESDHEFGIALLNGSKPVLFRFAGGKENGPVKHGFVSVRRVGSHTYYETAIAWSELTPTIPKPGTIFGISVVVNDNDGNGRGYMEWGGGLAKEKRPSQFPPMRLVK